ncbi:MAG: ribonuclease H-like domain-containing protein [Clostridia bacterium]|nr:ribonuclease H-like domain-containing protein [Clostridia bacterium]
MKIIQSNVNEKEIQSRVLDTYLKDLNYACLDIETTGLNPKYTKVILVGFFYYDKQSQTFVSRQYLAEDQSQEKELLLAVKEELSNFDYVITFNGRHFDIPFLVERFKKYKILFTEPLYDLDIYLVLNGYSDLKHALPNLKQKTVEKYMGLSDGREDKINGKESILLYNEYEATKDPILEKVICLHNSDDIHQLYLLKQVLKQADMHKAFSKLGFPVNEGIAVRKISLNPKELIATGVHKREGYVNFNDFYLNLDELSKEFILKIPVIRKYGGAYINLEELGLDKDDFSHLPGYVNGKLILENKNTLNYLEINMAIKKVLEKF